MSKEHDLNEIIRIKQLEEELKARERLTATAEHEIERVWSAYGRVTKVSSIILIILGVVGGIFVFFGYRSWEDFKASLQKSEKEALTNEVTKIRGQIAAELERQFAGTNIQSMIADKTSEQIDKTAAPQIQNLMSKQILPQIYATSNRIEILQSNIVTAESILKGFFDMSKAIAFDFSKSNSYSVVKTLTNGGTIICFLLPEVPIEGSLRLQYHVYEQPPGSYGNIGNLVIFNWGESLDNLRSHQVYAWYVADKTNKNIIHSFGVKDGMVFPDNGPPFRVP
jgi:hypothetical protein